MVVDDSIIPINELKDLLNSKISGIRIYWTMMKDEIDRTLKLDNIHSKIMKKQMDKIGTKNSSDLKPSNLVVANAPTNSLVGNISVIGMGNGCIFGRKYLCHQASKIKPNHKGIYWVSKPFESTSGCHPMRSNLSKEIKERLNVI